VGAEHIPDEVRADEPRPARNQQPDAVLLHPSFRSQAYGMSFTWGSTRNSSGSL
jgi:hypothetical protein